MFDKFEKKLLKILAATMLGLLALVAVLCVFADHLRTKQVQEWESVEFFERSRKARQKINIAMWRIVSCAQNFPISGFINLQKIDSKTADFLSLVDSRFNFVHLANAEDSADFFTDFGIGGNGLEGIPDEERYELEKKVVIFANSKFHLPGTAQFLASIEKNRYEATGSKKRESSFSKKPESSPRAPWVAKTSPIEDLEFPQKDIVGWSILQFQGNFWLIREIRGNAKRRWIQGFLLNSDKLLARLNGEFAGTPFHVEFSPIKPTEKITPWDIPLIILPENVSAGTLKAAKISAFRVALFAIFAVILLICAAIFWAFWDVAKKNSRERLFAAAIAHELCSPLVLLESRAGKLEQISVGNPTVSREISKQKYDLQNLIKQVENLLMFSKISRKIVKFVPAKKPFGEIFEPILQEIATRLEALGGDLEADLPDDAKAIFVRVAPEALEHILMNLAENAVKYAKNPAGTLLFSIRVKLENQRLRIFVSDNGNGVPEEIQRHLFKEFSRVDYKNLQNGRLGLGIGLALARKLARLNAGNLSLLKSDSAGTVFVLDLKLLKN